MPEPPNHNHNCGRNRSHSRSHNSSLNNRKLRTITPNHSLQATIAATTSTTNIYPSPNHQHKHKNLLRLLSLPDQLAYSVVKSETGMVGLVNLGNTCYMNRSVGYQCTGISCFDTHCSLFYSCNCTDHMCTSRVRRRPQGIISLRCTCCTSFGNELFHFLDAHHTKAHARHAVYCKLCSRCLAFAAEFFSASPLEW